jgi:hypothetical protein
MLSILSNLSGLLVLIVFSTGAWAQKRTYPVPDYKADPQAAFDLSIEEDFENPRKYSDPDFNIALALPSPLLDRRFESYEVIVIANQEDLNGEPGQTVRVYDREVGLRYFWRSSTARAGKVTPNGYFRVEGFSSRHQSSLYDNAPMPWAIFFNGNIATHGVYNTNIDRLGTRASAGCVRLEPNRARALFHLIGNSGAGWVDEINANGFRSLGVNGQPIKKWGYRTLVIVKSSELPVLEPIDLMIQAIR